MEHGARYVGDEWVYHSTDGATWSGIPSRSGLGLVPGADAALSRLTGRGDAWRPYSESGVSLEGKLPAVPGRKRRGASPIVGAPAFVDLPPERVFALTRCAAGRRHRVFRRHVDAPGVRVAAVPDESPGDVFSCNTSGCHLWILYDVPIAFPACTPSWKTRIHQRELLRAMLAGKACYWSSTPTGVIEDRISMRHWSARRAARPENI